MEKFLPFAWRTPNSLRHITQSFFSLLLHTDGVNFFLLILSPLIDNSGREVRRVKKYKSPVMGLPMSFYSCCHSAVEKLRSLESFALEIQLHPWGFVRGCTWFVLRVKWKAWSSSSEWISKYLGDNITWSDVFGSWREPVTFTCYANTLTVEVK